jgi:hypothetical protein
VYSTYFGGSGFEAGYGVAVDGSGNAFVAGSTWSSNFPTVQPVQEWAGYYDAFVGKFSDGSSPVATLTSIQPKSGQRGTVVNVTLTGTNFSTGLTTVGLTNPLNGGPDRTPPVTIGSIHVTSPASLTATVTIPSGAAVGERTVTVTAPGGSSQETVLFSVR